MKYRIMLKIFLIALGCMLPLSLLADPKIFPVSVQRVFQFQPFPQMAKKHRMHVPAPFERIEVQVPIHKDPEFEKDFITKRDLERATPFIEEGKLYLGSQWGYVICFDLQSDQLVWITKLDGGVVSAPAMQRGILYVGTTAGSLYAVAAGTGQLLWHFRTLTPITAPPAVSGDVLYFLTASDILVALDSRSGKKLWDWRPISEQERMTTLGAGAPLVVGDLVVAGMSDGIIRALQRKEGALAWQADLQSQNKKFVDIDASPVLLNTTVIVPTFEGALYALNSKNGHTLWAVGEGAASSAVSEGGLLYYASHEGTLFAIQSDTGTVLRKRQVNAGVLTRPAIIGNILFTSSSEGKIYAVDKNNFEELWSYDGGTNSAFYGEIAVFNRSLYLLSMHSSLYKITLGEMP